ncbi:MAG: 3H domain-containing protein [Clostridia bacterium]
MISSITDGVHMHKVEADSEKELLNIEAKLEQVGILMK